MRVYKFRCNDCGARKYQKIDGKNCEIYKCCYCGSTEEVYKLPKEEIKKAEEPKNENLENIKDASLKLQKKKRKFTSAVLELIACFFFGSVGLHKFLQKKFLLGIVYIFTFGFFGVGIFIDLLRSLVNVANASAEYRDVESELYYIENERGE